MPTTSVNVAILAVCIWAVSGWVPIRFGSNVPIFATCIFKKCTTTRITAVSGGFKIKSTICVWIIECVFKHIAVELIDYIVASVEDVVLVILSLTFFPRQTPAGKHKLLSNEVTLRAIPWVDIVDSFYSVWSFSVKNDDC